MKRVRSIACGLAGLMIGLSASPAYAAVSDAPNAVFATASTSTGDDDNALKVKPEDEAKIMDVMSKIGVLLYSPFDTSRSSDTTFAEVAQSGNIESLIGNTEACDEVAEGRSYQALSALNAFNVIDESSFPREARCTLAAYLYYQRGLSADNSVSFPITAVDYSQIQVIDDTHITIPSEAVTYGFLTGNPDVMLAEYNLVNVDGQWKLDLSENYTELMVSASATPSDSTVSDGMSTDMSEDDTYAEQDGDDMATETAPTVDGELAVTGSRTAWGMGVIAVLVAAVSVLSVARRRVSTTV